MKTKNFLVALIFFISVNAFAQTNVSGPYFSNTTWNLSGSPYNVVGDVQIPSGVTLTIEPGVQINFTWDYEILVKGTIVANGTSASPIIFVGNTSGTAMLMFKSTNLSNSQLSHIQFTGTKDAFQLADESEFIQDPTKNSGVLTVRNVRLTNTKVQTKGYQTTASLIIDSATATTTTFKGVYPRSETIEVRNSTLNNCTINSDSYNYGITLINSYITSSAFTIGCCGANFNIIKSSIENSNFSDYNDYYMITVDESQIINTPMNLPNSDYGVFVSKSYISYNSSYAIKCKKLTMTCTELEGSGNGIGIELLDGNNYISKSTFQNNYIAIKNNSNSSSITIDSTNFFNNIQYDIRNLSSQNISASKNWWGTTDSTIIANKIYDYYDNINYGIINFSNKLDSIYSLQSCKATPICPNISATILPAGPFCTSDAPVQLTSVDAGGIWYGVGLTIPSPSGIFSPSTAGAGTHTITYTISSGACGDTGTTNIVVLDCNDVWPGDANSDGVANNLDILPIGVGYNSTGTARSNASINWTEQTASDWTDSLASGINYKHIDCNGDGTINDNDTTAIVQNYGKIHYKFSGTNKTTMAPLLYFDFSEDTILAGSTLAVPLMFGTSSIPTTNFYGMAFTVGYNPTMVDSTKGVYMSFDNSWLGTIGSNMISIQKNFHSNGELEIGVTKINHSNVASGFGQIGTMYIVMEDNLSGKKNQLETFSLSLSNVKVISNDESIVSIDLGDDSVVVQSTGINEFNALEKYFSVYPVPASDKLYIEYSNIQIDKIELLNMAGQNVFLINAVDRQKLSINTSNLPQGIYLLKIETDKGMYSKKINIK